jgi:hypothetical protein
MPLTQLTTQAIASALSDLPQGGRHALRSCLLEWEAGRLPSQHLVAFVRSIAWQSPSLTCLRPCNQSDTAADSLAGDPNGSGTTACELLSAEDMQVTPTQRARKRRDSIMPTPPRRCTSAQMPPPVQTA